MIDQTYERTADRLAAQLRGRRRALGMTQEEVAELAGATQRFVSTLESGKPTVRLDKVIDVAEALGLRLVLAPHDAAAELPDPQPAP